MTQTTNRPPARPWAVVAVVIGAGALALYLGVIIGEANDSVAEIAPWAAAMALATAGAAVGAWRADRPAARLVLWASAAVFTALGLVSLASIGVFFLAAAGAAAIAAVRSPGPRPREADRPHGGRAGDA